MSTLLSNFRKTLRVVQQKTILLRSKSQAAASATGAKPGTLPPVDGSDIVSYLVLQTSFVTAKQFKAHKSMEAYNQFVCGWVKDVRSWSAASKCIVTGKVT